MKKLLLFTIAIAIFLSACEERNTPEPTPDPKPHVNKFNCKINGKYWEVIPKELHLRPIQSNTLMVDFYIIKNDTLLQIWADHEANQNEINMLIPLSNNMEITKNTNPRPYSNYNPKVNCGFYYKDSTKLDIVKILENDFKSKLIKGSFEFTTFGDKCLDTLHITEGYFDVNY